MNRVHTRRFPAAIRHDGRDYLTTEQVAKVLGVKRSTIYAYVSRGRLTSHRITGVDGSVFAVDEIEALLATGPRRRPPAGVAERIRTQLTYLHDDRLYYRGRDVAELAGATSYESAAQLLWGIAWPDSVAGDRALGAAVRRVAGARARGLDRIRLAVDLCGARDSARHRIDDAAVVTKAASTITAAVSAVGDPGDRDAEREGSLAQRLWPRLTDEIATADAVRVLDAALVLLADHDMSAGAVAARVAASARGSIYAVIGAGLGAFDGPMHGGATTLAYRFLAGALDDPAAAVADAEYRGIAIAGTGHVIYTRRDPRAAVLLPLLRQVGIGDRRVLDAVDVIAEAVGPSTFVNSDMALAAMALQFRMRPDAAETVFAIARMAGWVAHALEEYREPRLRFRPEGVYTGIKSPGSTSTGSGAADRR